MGLDVKGIIKKLEEHKISLESERDKLREFIYELKDLKAVADRAIESIEEATDALSELV